MGWGARFGISIEFLGVADAASEGVRDLKVGMISVFTYVPLSPGQFEC